MFVWYSYTAPSAGVFFLVDFDTIMPTKDSAGAPLAIQERLDDAVSAMLRCGVFIVCLTCAPCGLIAHATVETDHDVRRSDRDPLQDDVHST